MIDAIRDLFQNGQPLVVEASVPADDYERAREIAGMARGGDSLWGWLGKAIIALVLFGLVVFVLMGGAA